MNPITIAVVVLGALMEAQGIRSSNLFSDTYVTNPNRIIVPVTRSMMPFQVYIRSTKRPTQRCLGSLISARYVLTAASCNLTSNVEVIAGAENLHDERNSTCRSQRRNVVLVKEFPRYSAPLWQHDLAVVKLNTPFELNECIQPIRIYKEDFFMTGHLKTVGYGFTSEQTVWQTCLSRVSMNLVSRATCTRRLNSTMQISKSHLCARIPALGIKMDYFGGPVVHLEPNLATFFDRKFFTEKSEFEWKLVGVLSFQQNAEAVNNTYVITRTSQYCSFIAGATHYSAACW